MNRPTENPRAKRRRRSHPNNDSDSDWEPEGILVGGGLDSSLSVVWEESDNDDSWTPESKESSEESWSCCDSDTLGDECPAVDDDGVTEDEALVSSQNDLFGSNERDSTGVPWGRRSLEGRKVEEDGTKVDGDATEGRRKKRESNKSND